MSLPIRSLADGRGSSPMQGYRGSESLVDPQTLMAIKNLELRAKVVVEGFWHGLHKSPYHGFSVEFSEYRQYSRGDDLRYLDWRLYARSDRFYIKKFEEETNLRCYLLVDNSRSMAYGSLAYTKSQYVNTLAATLAYFLYLQGDSVGLLTFADEILEYIPAHHRRGHLRQLMRILEKPPSGNATNLVRPLQRVVEIVKKRGLMILITDLLAPIEALQKYLSSLRACGHETFLMHVLDPAELTFNFDQAALYYDPETGRDLYIDPAQARAAYLAKLEAHNCAARATCEKLGITYQRFATNRPLELALFDFLRQRIQQGKQVKRALANL